MMFLLLLLSSPAVAGDYEDGYEAGWQVEYGEVAAPQAPTPPAPIAGEDSYEQGVVDGYEDAKQE